MSVRGFTGGLVKNKEIIADPYFQLVVIGASLGGLNALTVVLGNLPKNFPVPVAVAQHRHPNANEDLSALLQKYTHLIVKDAEDKEEISPQRRAGEAGEEKGAGGECPTQVVRSLRIHSEKTHRCYLEWS